MSDQARSDIEITGWDEAPYAGESDGTSLAHAVVRNHYTGDIEGDGRLDLLLTYTKDSASYVGQERIVGSVHGRGGSFVLRHTGVFANGTVTTRWDVIDGSGTGELTALTGQGGYEAGESRHITGATLSYELQR